jgi:hypothetical protein
MERRRAGAVRGNAFLAVSRREHDSSDFLRTGGHEWRTGNAGASSMAALVMLNVALRGRTVTRQIFASGK